MIERELMRRRPGQGGCGCGCGLGALLGLLALALPGLWTLRRMGHKRSAF